MVSEEAVPTADEIRIQLARMLASKRFKGAQNSADFLELVVTRALAGQRVTGAIIGKRIFKGKYKPTISSDVRVAANTLRKKLTLYRENEGRDDPIVIKLPDPPEDKRIKLPEGEAYRPLFAYNAESEIAKEYRLGLYFLSPKRPYELSNATEHFKNVGIKNPLHLGAYIGMIEAFCLLAFMGWETTVYVNAALEVAPKALALGKENWHANAAAGAAWLLATDIERATKAFEKALILNRGETLQYGWYHAALLVTGHEAEALALARARADANPDDAVMTALYGLYLYASRQFEEATAVLKNALELDPNCWSAHLALALVHLACGDTSNAVIQLMVMDHALQQGEDRYFFPGLRALAQTVSGTEHSPSVIKNASTQLLEAPEPSPVQLALLFMGIPDHRKALNYLVMAWFSYEPLILFLTKLPVFDPLRNVPGFQTLVRLRLFKRPRAPFDCAPKWNRKNAENPPQSSLAE